MPTIDIESIIGRTYLTEPTEDGMRHRGTVVEAIEDHQRNVAGHPETRKFRCTVKDKDYDEVLTYNQILNYLEKDDDDGTYKFKEILDHDGHSRRNIRFTRARDTTSRYIGKPTRSHGFLCH